MPPIYSASHRNSIGKEARCYTRVIKGRALGELRVQAKSSKLSLSRPNCWLIKAGTELEGASVSSLCLRDEAKIETEQEEGQMDDGAATAGLRCFDKTCPQQRDRNISEIEIEQMAR